jgi:PKD repeat protein
VRTVAAFLILSSAAAAQVTVSGVVRYEDRIYGPGGFTTTTFRPVRQAEIEVLQSGQPPVPGTTDDTGVFTVPGIPSGVSVQVRIYARRIGGQINASVLNNAGAHAVYTAISPAIDTGVTPTFGTIDLTIANGAAPAFNIFDAAVKTFQYLNTVEPALPETPPPMTVYWEDLTSNGTYFDGLVNAIFLLGQTSDPDQYDDDIILHEMGHWVAFNFSHDDTLGGPHRVIDQLDPRTSWSEGWAHYWSAIVRRFFPSEYANPQLQIDNFGSGNSAFDIDLPSFPDLAVMATNELAVAAVLWHISTATNEALDPVNGNELDIWRAVRVRIPARLNITLEDFHAGLALEAPGILAAVTGSESQPGIFKDRKIRYYPDGSEPNDSSGSPVLLALGPVGLTERTFYAAGDEDWYRVDASSGNLLIETLNLGDGVDTLLQLYDAAGTTLIDQNDDRSAADRSSRLLRTVDSPTTFLVRVVRQGAIIEYGYYDLRAQIVINVPPVLTSVSASTLSGPAPLRVSFSAAVSDPDGGNLEYFWDFNGDGLVDWSSLEGPSVTITYDEAGIYAARLRVVDSGDSEAISAPLIISVLGTAAPSIFPAATSNSGTAPLTVGFSATVSGVVPTAYLWDFDGDGIPDSASVTSATASFTFREPGTYVPRLLVRDSQGRAFRTLATPITVAAGPSPPTLTSPSVTDGFLPYAATVSLAHSDLGPTGSVAFDADGDGRIDQILLPGSASGTLFPFEIRRAGGFTSRLHVTDSSGQSVSATCAYVARSSGVQGWLIDPIQGDRLAGTSVTLTAEVIPFGVVKSVQFQYRPAPFGGGWINIGPQISGSGTLFSTPWNVSGLTDLSSFNLRVLIDGTISSGDTTATIVVDTTAPTISEIGSTRTKSIRTDQTTVSRNGSGVWALLPVGTTADALPLRMEPSGTPPANGSAASLIPVGQAWKLTFGGTFQNTFRLRLPFSGPRTDFEIHHYDDVAGAWQRLGHSRVGSADGWVEADVNADGVYSLFAPPVYMSHHHSGVCGALGLEAALALGLIRLLRRGRC